MNQNEEIPIERIKEEIKISTEMLRFMVVIFLALVSGELSLLFKDELSLLESLFLVGGFITTLGTLFVIYYYNRYIYSLIKKIK